MFRKLFLGITLLLSLSIFNQTVYAVSQLGESEVFFCGVSEDGDDFISHEVDGFEKKDLIFIPDVVVYTYSDLDSGEVQSETIDLSGYDLSEIFNLSDGDLSEIFNLSDDDLGATLNLSSDDRARTSLLRLILSLRSVRIEGQITGSLTCWISVKHQGIGIPALDKNPLTNLRMSAAGYSGVGNLSFNAQDVPYNFLGLNQVWRQTFTGMVPALARVTVTLTGYDGNGQFFSMSGEMRA